MNFDLDESFCVGGLAKLVQSGSLFHTSDFQPFLFWNNNERHCQRSGQDLSTQSSQGSQELVTSTSLHQCKSRPGQTKEHCIALSSIHPSIHRSIHPYSHAITRREKTTRGIEWFQKPMKKNDATTHTQDTTTTTTHIMI